MSLHKALAGVMGSQGGGVEEPEGVSFDGETDYLSRSTALVGDSSSYTFTISFCFYRTAERGHIDVNEFYYYFTRGYIGFNTTGDFFFVGSNTGSSVDFIKIDESVVSNFIASKTWNHVLISGDTSVSGKAHIFINDVDFTGLASISFNGENISWDYTGGVIAEHCKSRLSHFFRDNVYRDLSIEANRRAFITEDLKPADGQASLNPILYLPMEDAATAHINEGTGGDFVQNGVLATADRGANQWNCVASEFDGVDDYLSSTGLAGGTTSKEITVSFNASRLGGTGDGYVFFEEGYRLYIDLRSADIQVRFEDVTHSKVVFYWNSNTDGINTVNNQNISLSLSIDLTDSTKTRVFYNGVSYNITPSVFDSTGYFEFDRSFLIAGKDTTSYPSQNVSVGEIYIDDSYIDLATENPFWIED